MTRLSYHLFLFDFGKFISLRFNKRSQADLYKLSPKGFDAVKSRLNSRIRDVTNLTYWNNPGNISLTGIISSIALEDSICRM